jgi:hypothetical protein
MTPGTTPDRPFRSAVYRASTVPPVAIHSRCGQGVDEVGVRDGFGGGLGAGLGEAARCPAASVRG